jgi:GTP pyrophosphokinase
MNIFEEVRKVEKRQISRAIKFIQNYAHRHRLNLTIKALHYAEMLHCNQKRKDSSDYLSHPVKVCLMLISCGIQDDAMLAAALLHDVIEETKATHKDLKEWFTKEIADIVFVLSKKKRISAKNYFGAMSKNFKAVIIKAADRMGNVGDMVDYYTPEKIRAYIWETEHYLYPLIEKSWHQHPKFTTILAFFHDYLNVVFRADKKVLELFKKIAKLEDQNRKIKRRLDLCREKK